MLLHHQYRACLGHTTPTSSELFWVCYSQSALRFLRALYPDEFRPVYHDNRCLHEVSPSPIHDLQAVVEETFDFSDVDFSDVPLFGPLDAERFCSPRLVNARSQYTLDAIP